MKKIFYWAGLAMVLASCSGKSGDNRSSMSDSALTQQVTQELEGSWNYYLTSDSIGPVKVGERIENLPAGVENLYDEVLPTETPDAMAYTYMLAAIPQFTIYDFMEGKVDVIVLEGNARSVQTPEGELRVGDPFSKVLALSGVTSSWEGYDDMGLWYWKWNGLYFGVDEASLSEEASTALTDSKRPPRTAIFTPDVKIGYIATGLPF